MSEDSNAALNAKVMAMYGKRLTPLNYRELLRKQTVPEVAAYLKQQTDYADTLHDINENLVHRGQLEMQIRKRIFEDFSELSHYMERDGKGTAYFYTADMEMREILNALRLISAGRQDEYIYSLPSFLARNASFDLYGLAKVNNYGDLLELLRNTPYYGLLKKHEPAGGAKADIEALETDFRNYYYSLVFESAGEGFGDDVTAAVRKIAGMEADLENLTIILRLKRYFRGSAATIRPMLLHYHYKLSETEIQGMLQEQDPAAVWKQILATYYGDYFKKYDFDSIERYSKQVLYDVYRSLLYFAQSSTGIVLAYLYLKNIEINNLISIIEGIRYGLPPAEIDKLLTGAEQ